MVCAILAAAFWGLNFTAIYPVLKIIGSGQNLQQWVDTSITAVENERIKPQLATVDELTKPKCSSRISPISMTAQFPIAGHCQPARQGGKQTGKRRAGFVALAHRQARISTCFFPRAFFRRWPWSWGWSSWRSAIKGFLRILRRNRWSAASSTGSLYDLRNRFYRNAIHLDVEQFQRSRHQRADGPLHQRHGSLGTGQKTLFGKVIAEPLRALACVIVACWISWQLTLMFLILVPFALFVLTKVGRHHEAGHAATAGAHVEHLQDSAGDVPGHPHRQGVHQ